MNQEDVKKALEALGGATFNIAGDFVLEKNNTYTIEKVEAGGIGMQFVNGKEAETDTDGSNGSDSMPQEEAHPAKCFVDTVKRIMKNAEKDNGKEKPLTARGNGGTYTYFIEGDKFGQAMDQLLEYHKDALSEYLEGADAKKAVKMKYVCPFLGAVLDTHLFSPTLMPKGDLEPALNTVYGEGSSAASKLNGKQLPESGKLLVGLLKQY